MSDNAQLSSRSRSLDRGYESGGWAGWHGFAAVMLFIIGLFNAFDGLIAVLNDEILLGSGKRVTVVLDITQWGWVHIVLGLVLAAGRELSVHGACPMLRKIARLLDVTQQLHFV